MTRMRRFIGGLKRLISAYNIRNCYDELIMEIKLANDFKDFLRLLNAKQVDYLLIGGYAVSYHGYPRATGDMDVCKK